MTIHDGGWILTATGSKGTFGGNARIESDGTIMRGELEYHDHNPVLPINFHSIEVLEIVCEPIYENDGVDEGQRASSASMGSAT
jgi:hypothetical protein